MVFGRLMIMNDETSGCKIFKGRENKRWEEKSDTLDKSWMLPWHTNQNRRWLSVALQLGLECE